VLGVGLAVALAVGGRHLAAVEGAGNLDPSPVVTAAAITGGGSVRIPARGSRPTVVAFFASWCNQCRAELQVLQTYNELVGSQVSFIGVDFSDETSRIREVLRDTGVRFPVISDRTGTIAGRFEIYGVPNTFFIDAAGNIVERSHGFDADLGRSLTRNFGVDVRRA
jgi:cytochrome c biogenesis protein CcmG/thiol:disulfide interchange protein DsbE